MSFLREAYVIIMLLPVLKCSVKILCKSLSENTVAKMQKILACVCRLLIILLCFCQLRPHQKESSKARASASRVDAGEQPAIHRHSRAARIAMRVFIMDAASRLGEPGRAGGDGEGGE